MSKPITSTYREVEITYYEDSNTWRFTVNGRERSAEGLVKARESIDRAFEAVKKDKSKAWQPFDAYFCRYNDSDFVLVKVTSVAEHRYGAQHFWISNGKSRSKEDGRYLFKVTPENEALIADIKRLAAEISELEAQESVARGNLVKIDVPKED